MTADQGRHLSRLIDELVIASVAFATSGNSVTKFLMGGEVLSAQHAVSQYMISIVKDTK